MLAKQFLPDKAKKYRGKLLKFLLITNPCTFF